MELEKEHVFNNARMALPPELKHTNRPELEMVDLREKITENNEKRKVNNWQPELVGNVVKVLGTNNKRKRLKTQHMPSGTGQVYFWGNLIFGLDESTKKLPALAPRLGNNIIQVACGGEHIICLRDDGNVFSWGSNCEGQLGRISKDSAMFADLYTEEYLSTIEDEELTPAMVSFGPSIVSQFIKAVRVSAGEFHSAALFADGSVYVWGLWKTEGRQNSRISPGVPKAIFPQPLCVDKIRKIACGGNHFLMLNSKGEVWGMGHAGLGQLGKISQQYLEKFAEEDQVSDVTEEFSDSELVSIPIKICTPETIVEIFTGKNCSFVTGQSGKTYACGHNKYGQLGCGKLLESNVNVNTDKLKEENNADAEHIQNCADNGESIVCVVDNFVETFRGISIKQISGGLQHTIALSQEGKMHACGDAVDGRLGIVTQTEDNIVWEPTEIVGDFQNQIQAVCAGEDFSGCVDSSGQGFLWGLAEEFRLGNANEDDNVTKPAKMKQTRKFYQQKILQMELGAGFGACVSVSRPTTNPRD